MTPENIKKLELSVQNLKDKKARIYFIVQDTKGNAKASIRYIYQMAMSLKNEGYNPIMLHEKPDYTSVDSWLKGDYMNELPHKSIEGQNLEVSPEDLIIVPEIYGFIMDQLKNLPCGKIVLCQSYDYMMETLQPGHNWLQHGFTKCITTTEEQKEYISNVMRNVSIDIISPVINNLFEKQIFPPKPIISVHSRDQRDAVNLIKTFYLKYPQYRWITFRDMRSLSEEDFAKGLQDTFVSVWIDSISGFGTFPLESMKVGVPVIGKIPNLKPSWMSEENGIWTTNQNQIVDVIAEFIQNWLEDNISEKLYISGEETSKKYSSMENFESLVVSTFDGYQNNRLISFQEQLNKLEETIEQ
jgi:hypothetical protein